MQDQNANPLAMRLSLLVKQLAGMPPGVERDRLTAEMVEIKVELLTQQRERQLCAMK